MSTGQKRTRTIDAFFALKPKSTLDAALACGSATPVCALGNPGVSQKDNARAPIQGVLQHPGNTIVFTAADGGPLRGGELAPAGGSPGDSPRAYKRSRSEVVSVDEPASIDEKEPLANPPGAADGGRDPQIGGEGGGTQAGNETPAAGGEGVKPGANDDGGTPSERTQIAASRNRALARRAVSEASAKGTQLQLSSLLVESTWREVLEPQLASGYMRQLEAFLHAEWAPGRKAVFPPKDSIFQAFNACPFDKVRVVILGQDPYHGPGQAMGLSFSVPRGVRPLPPSLVNIYKEATADLGWADRPDHGDLSSWSVQGVLLLNTCLTVRQGEANSHAKRGWEEFTDAAIRELSERRSGLVFLLWGNPAQAKAKLVNTRKHHVLKSAHPSPLSASRGFFGCRHFSQANQLLEKQGLAPIEWRPA